MDRALNLLVTILAVILGLTGFIGGIWFWQKMAKSPIWEGMRKYVKLIGTGGAAGLFAILIFVAWKMEIQALEFYRQWTYSINIVSWFFLFYLLGYNASIFRPEPEEMKNSHQDEKSPLPLHIKWDLLIRELFLSIIAIVPGVALLLFSRIGIQVFGIWVAGVVGFSMGFFFWENLREFGILTGVFKRQTVILSLVTTVVMGYIASYGVYVSFFTESIQSIQIFLVSFMLFIECMAWYMVALCVVAFRVKQEKNPANL